MSKREKVWLTVYCASIRSSNPLEGVVSCCDFARAVADAAEHQFIDHFNLDEEDEDPSEA